RWRQFYNQFISLKGPPEKVARAFSIGLWIGWFPIIGTHSIMTVAAGAIFRLSVPAIFLASWICNPLTIPFLLLADYKVGSLYVGEADISGVQLHTLTFQQMIALGWNVQFPMIVGGVILGTLTALVAYYPIKYWVVRIRRHGAQPKPLEPQS
nr:DUF2062 domain-containing protein [bacterium]